MRTTDKDGSFQVELDSDPQRQSASPLRLAVTVGFRQSVLGVRVESSCALRASVAADL